jgi:hypothetical protein
MKGKKCRAAGGPTENTKGREHMVVSGNPDVLKEANERKRGGKVKKHIGEPEGEKSKHRMDRKMPHRKSGGRVGSDKNPYSSARMGGKTGERSDGEPD